MHLVKRDGYGRFVRRVPKEFLELDRHGIVQSTKIRVADDPRAIRAGEVAGRMNRALESLYWLSLADGNAGRAVAEYEAARNAARSMRISALS